MQGKLFVSINSPEKVLWEGEADAVSSLNSAGVFDILPGHANFITITNKQSVLVRRSDGDREFNPDTAVIYVRSNLVTVYTDI
jgi:F0F1-type ATP synthase epsilon subunit